MFDAKNFICWLSWSISGHFVAIHSLIVRCSQKCKNLLKTTLLGFKVV